VHPKQLSAHHVAETAMVGSSIHDELLERRCGVEGNVLGALPQICDIEPTSGQTRIDTREVLGRADDRRIAAAEPFANVLADAVDQRRGRS
jgi:hypothetical protein